MVNDATYAKHAAVANLESFVPNTQWALVERAFRGGSGLLVRFEARLVPGVARHLERLAALGDPQLAAPIEYGVDGDEAWLLYAGTLDDALDAHSGPLSMGEIAQLADALVAGLERAHDQGLLHPGISSSLVRMHIGFDGRVHPELLGLGLPSPTPRTVQDDLADLAALLYTLYTGRPPFEPGVPRDGSVAPKPFADTRPSGAAPQSFETAVLRALGPRASAFWTAAEMRAALTVVAVGRQTGARIASTTNQNLSRVLRRDSSVVAPLPVAAPVPPSYPSEAFERPLSAVAPRAPRRALWPIAALLLLAVGIALGLLLGGGSTPAPPTSASALAQSAPIEPNTPLSAQPRTPPGVAAPVPAEVIAQADPAQPEASPIPAPVKVEPVAEPARVEPPAPAPVPDPATLVTHLALSSVPSDCAVTINGTVRGRTPLELELRPADLPARVVFERKGMLAEVRTVETIDGPTAALAVTLRPRPKAVATSTANPNTKPTGNTIILGR